MGMEGKFELEWVYMLLIFFLFWNIINRGKKSLIFGLFWNIKLLVWCLFINSICCLLFRIIFYLEPFKNAKKYQRQKVEKVKEDGRMDGKKHMTGKK